MQQDPIDHTRLLDRIQHYAEKAGASSSSIQNMLDMLQSKLGQAVLKLAANPVLQSFLVNDLYKVHMQSMYAQYMTGATADFALNIRKCPRLVSSSSSSSSSNSSSSKVQPHPGTANGASTTACGKMGGNSSNGSIIGPTTITTNSTSRSSSSGSVNPAAYVLADIREQHPDIFSELTLRISQQLQVIDPLSDVVLEALKEFNDYEAPQVLLDRLHAHGVAAVEWVDIEGAPVAVGSGPIEAASNTETSVMQAVQAAIIAAAAAEATPHDTNSKDSASSHDGGQQQQQQQRVPLLDRIERLASSLGKMVMTVEQLNEIPHECSIMLMAGRRSTDLLHLLLQNLYFMKHVRGYAGTSSLLAAAVLRQLLQQQGMEVAERKRLVGRIMGTHAHEMTSMVQQLMCGFDAEAGTKCELEEPVCISQLLAHMLFLTANGGSNRGSSSNSDHSNTTNSSTSTETPSTDASTTNGNSSDTDDHPADVQAPSSAGGSSSSSSSSMFAGGTALADTFTTPYFVRLAEMTDLPPEFVSDMRDKWGVDLEPGSKVFDLFSVWRLDSGSYPDLAQLIHDAWTRRNKDRASVGMLPLPPLQLLHSNISTLDDIRQLVALPSHIRPIMLGFGGVADGFMPFTITTSPAPATDASSAAATTATTAAAPVLPSGMPSPAAAAAAAAPAASWQVILPVCSLVMKAVQARLPPRFNSSSSNTPFAAAAAPAGPTDCDNTATPPSSAEPPAAAAAAATVVPAEGANTVPVGAMPVELSPSAPLSQPPPSAAAAALGGDEARSSAAAAAAVLKSAHQPCAVKLGDGDLSKAQTDPRLPPRVRQGVLGAMQAMVKAGGQLERGKHGQVLSEVLREAYVAVVRQGVLMAEAQPSEALLV